MQIRAARFIAHLAQKNSEDQYNTASNGTPKATKRKLGKCRGPHCSTKTQQTCEMLLNYHTQIRRFCRKGYKLLILSRKLKKSWMTMWENPARRCSKQPLRSPLPPKAWACTPVFTDTSV